MFLLIEINRINTLHDLSRFAVSWIDTRDPAERANLTILFDKYVPTLVEVMKVRFKKITPLPEICHVEMLCRLLDYFLIKENVTPDCPKEWYKRKFLSTRIYKYIQFRHE